MVRKIVQFEETVNRTDFFPVVTQRTQERAQTDTVRTAVRTRSCERSAGMYPLIGQTSSTKNSF